MKHPNRRRTPLALAALGALAAFPALAAAENVTAVTTTGRLITFDTGSPGTITSDRAISGVTGTIVGIDVRPEDGTLFAVTDGARLYRLDPATGQATQVGTGTFAAALGTVVGMDFNPVLDKLRIVADLGRNLRVNAADGTLVDGNPGAPGAQEDSPLSYAFDDPKAGMDPLVAAVAYNNNTKASSGATAFGIDTALDILVVLNQPNAGIVGSMGTLGIDASSDVSFDVSGVSGTAYAAIRLEGGAGAKLYTINLNTGLATLVGTVGGSVALRGMTLGLAASPPSVPNREMLGLTTGGELVRFSTGSPGTIAARVPVTGLVLGDSLVGIDTRPANGLLYGVGAQGRLYTVNVTTGVASQVGTETFAVPLAGTAFGVDFDAASDRLRIVSDADQNLRVDPADGTVVDGNAAADGTQPDTNLAYAFIDFGSGDDPFIAGAACDRNDAKSGVTLYGIDTSEDTLVRQGDTGGGPESPDTGVLHTVGHLSIDTNELVGFEIAGDTLGLASLTDPGGSSRLFAVDLATGVTTLLGQIGTAETLRGLTLVPSANTTPPVPLVVKQLTIRLNHRTAGNRDTVTIVGRVPRPSSTAGKVAIVEVGGFTETFTLNTKGWAKNKEGTPAANDDDQFRYTTRRKNGVYDFTVNLRREDLSDELADEGLTPGVVRNRKTSVRVTVTVDGVSYTALVPVKYSSQNGNDATAVKR